MLKTTHTKALSAALLITAGLHGSLLWSMNDMATGSLPAQITEPVRNLALTQAAAPGALAAAPLRRITLEPVLVQASRRAYLAEQATARALAASRAAQSAQGECTRPAADAMLAWSAAQAGTSHC